MIALLIAAQLSQIQPVPKPVRPTIAPKVVLDPAELRRRQMVTDAHALLAQAQAASHRYRPRAGQPAKAELDAQADRLKGDLDSMSDMSDMDSLRLQMAMDRLSKTMSMLSNILKNISDTDQSITNNIK